MTRKLLLVAGPSGSGKSRLTRMAGAASISLDEFYRDHDFPDMPKSPFGITDWDQVGSWDLEHAVHTLRLLLDEGRAEVPMYDISISERIGTRVVECEDAKLIVAEGIFAPDTYRAVLERGIPARAIWLDRPRAANFSRRLLRDLKERRKPPGVLFRRGLALYRDEPAKREAALAAGFTPMSIRKALKLVEEAGLSPAESARRPGRSGRAPRRAS